MLPVSFNHIEVAGSGVSIQLSPQRLEAARGQSSGSPGAEEDLRNHCGMTDGAESKAGVKNKGGNPTDHPGAV